MLQLSSESDVIDVIQNHDEEKIVGHRRADENIDHSADRSDEQWHVDWFYLERIATRAFNIS